MRFYSFVFTGKERDEETGYGYFGARYMDHELTTMWLSVDPMADKYPSISPYAYCAWNPVKLVDPDGRKIKLAITNTEGKESTVDVNSIDDFPDDERMNILREIYKTNEGKEIISKVMSTQKVFTIKEKMEYIGEHEVSPFGDVSWGLPHKTHGGDERNILAEEMYHCYQVAMGFWKFDESMSRETMLNCEILAKTFAAETFSDYNNYFFESGYYIPTQMNIMRNGSYEMKKSYLKKDKTTKLPMYDYNPQYDVFNPKSCGKYYYHKGAY